MNPRPCCNTVTLSPRRAQCAIIAPWHVMSTNVLKSESETDVNKLSGAEEAQLIWRRYVTSGEMSSHTSGAGFSVIPPAASKQIFPSSLIKLIKQILFLIVIQLLLKGLREMRKGVHMRVCVCVCVCV